MVAIADRGLIAPGEDDRYSRLRLTTTHDEIQAASRSVEVRGSTVSSRSKLGFMITDRYV